MKNICKIIFVFLIVSIIIIINTNSVRSRFVFKNNNIDNTFNYFYINFNNKVSSKNFEEYINRYDKNIFKVIKIYPKLNNDNVNFRDYEYNYSSLSINKITKSIINNLKKHDLDDEILNINIYGFQIYKILVYSNTKYLDNHFKDKYYFAE